MPGSPSVAALVAPFAAWLGRWEGEGRGLWAAEPPFRYRDSLTIEAVPDRALLLIAQRTTVFDSGELSHAEMGYLRVLPDQRVELVLAVPAGYVEVHTGQLQGGLLELQPHSISASPTARPLRLVQRRWERDQDVLRSSVGIAIGDQPLAAHVESWLRRTASAG